MNRRELLSAMVPAVFLTPTLAMNGITRAAAVAVPPGHYLLFVDVTAVDMIDLIDNAEPLPPGITIEVHPVKLRQGQRVEDVVALFKAGE